MWYWFSHVSGVVKSYIMQLWDLPFRPQWCPCHRNILPHDHDMLLFFLTKWAFSKTSFTLPGFRKYYLHSLTIKDSSFCLFCYFGCLWHCLLASDWHWLLFQAANAVSQIIQKNGVPSFQIDFYFSFFVVFLPPLIKTAVVFSELKYCFS